MSSDISHAEIEEPRAAGDDIKPPMQLDLFGPWPRRGHSRSEEWLDLPSGKLRLHLCRNPRARRYILRLLFPGAARVTVPRGGSFAAALEFARAQVMWLEKQVSHAARRPRPRDEWILGSEIYWRGKPVRLECSSNGDANTVCLADQRIQVRDSGADLRPEVQAYLRTLAVHELPGQVFRLAHRHGLGVRRVAVRNQRSRWGSCSRRGTVSLNWRLVQAPEFVRDYLILHELAHLKEMNHSNRFWREVERLCPSWREAERWLKDHSYLLR